VEAARAALPLPGSMEMDLVAHCGEVNRGSYINSLVLTDIASGWTEAAPLAVRESGLVVETLERIRVALPFCLRALDVDYDGEFMNENLIRYCLGHGIELTRSRLYRNNDPAWIEQKNGAVVRKLLGYRRFEGLAAAKAITRLYGAARLFANFFQPSFELAARHREGAPPCERLLQAETISEAAKTQLREVAGTLDPAKLLEEIRAVQAHLMALAAEARPTFSIDAKPRHLRSLRSVARQDLVAVAQALPAAPDEKLPERSEVIYATRGNAKFHALTMVWPQVCRRLEGFPNINCTQLFEELCTQFPGRFTRWQYKRLLRRVRAWRKDARAQGVIIGRLKQRRVSNKPRGRRPDLFKPHWAEMLQCLEAQPDQTALALLVEFQARYPERYSIRNLSALRRRVRVWRREAAQRLASEVKD
jgi:hypothetical protein